MTVHMIIDQNLLQSAERHFWENVRSPKAFRHQRRTTEAQNYNWSLLKS